jgi:hypothetical protein
MVTNNTAQEVFTIQQSDTLSVPEIVNCAICPSSFRLANVNQSYSQFVSSTDSWDSWGTTPKLVDSGTVKWAITNYSKGNVTITHKTNVREPQVGRFCETTGEIYDGYKQIGITDCICKVGLSTELSTKVVGIITDGDNFASHGDVLVLVDEGEYHLGDLLVPTATGARAALEDEKLFIMINGLPRVRVTSVDSAVLPQINNRVCVACFMS